MFIRHQRSENSPATTQISPAKFRWTVAIFTQTWSCYVVENIFGENSVLVKIKTEHVEQIIFR